MYIYLQVNRSNIIQVWLAIQGQAGAKVHIIQHCMTFSFVNPKWFLKTKYLPGGCLQSLNKEMSAAVSRSVCSESGFSVYKNIQGFFDSNIALHFFFFLHDFKNYINDSNVIIVFAKRNPLNISFWGSVVFPMLIPSLQLKEAHKAFSLEEGGRANETVDGCVVWHLHSVINRTDGLILKKKLQENKTFQSVVDDHSSVCKAGGDGPKRWKIMCPNISSTKLYL